MDGLMLKPYANFWGGLVNPIFKIFYPTVGDFTFLVVYDLFFKTSSTADCKSEKLFVRFSKPLSKPFFVTKTVFWNSVRFLISSEVSIYFS